MRNWQVCVDAGLVIRLVLSSDDSIQSLWREWQDKERDVLAPTLLFYEVTNVLYRYHKHGIFSSEFVSSALQIALTVPITLFGDRELHVRARDLAEDYNLPAAYDAHYLAVAERMDCELWTTDERLVNTLAPFQLDWVNLV